MNNHTSSANMSRNERQPMLPPTCTSTSGRNTGNNNNGGMSGGGSPSQKENTPANGAASTRAQRQQQGTTARSTKQKAHYRYDSIGTSIFQPHQPQYQHQHQPQPPLQTSHSSSSVPTKSLSASAPSSSLLKKKLARLGKASGSGPESSGGGAGAGSKSDLWRRVQSQIPTIQIENVHSKDEGDVDEEQGGAGGAGGGGGGIATMAESASAHLEFRTEYCLLAIAAYLGLGAVFYSFVFEDWTVVDSLYFSVVTFTTVGYGDLVPTTHLGRLFTSVFSLVGISSLGIALGVIGNKLVEAQMSSMEEAKKESNGQLVRGLFRTDSEASVDARGSRVLGRSTSEGGPAGKRKARGATAVGVFAPRARARARAALGGSFRRYAPFVAALVASSCLIAWYEGWGFSKALYFCTMTTTTVGYGDLSPKTQGMRLFAIFFIPVAVGVMGEILSNLANYMMEMKREEFLEKLQKRSLRLEDLIAMDEDGDGNVTMLEYVEFMLVKLQKVDRTLLEELHDQFRKFDSDNSGTLAKSDLYVMAQRRLKRVDKKLELSKYKEKLLQKAASSEMVRQGTESQTENSDEPRI